MVSLTFCPTAHPAAALPAGPWRWRTALPAAIRTAAWLPDQAAVLALTTAGHLERLRAADGQPEWRHLPADGAMCLGLCPCGTLAATGHLDGTLRLRLTATGRVLNTVPLGPGWVEHVRWSPDGQRLAAVSGRVLYLLDGAGQLLDRAHQPEGCIDALSWAADSRRLATASGRTVRCWAVAAEAARWQPDAVWTDTQPVTALAWSPVGPRLVSGSRAGLLTSRLHPAGNTQERSAGRRPGPVPVLAWDDAGQWLAAPHQRQVCLWKTTAAGLRTVPLLLSGHPAPVEQLAFQPGGPLLASTAADGTLALWYPEQGATPRRLLSLPGPATTLHWAADGRSLVAGTAGGQVVLLRIEL